MTLSAKDTKKLHQMLKPGCDCSLCKPLDLGIPVLKNHKWDADGERCLNCGDKDWFADTYCGGKNA